MDHLCYLCHVFVMLLRLFIAAMWSPAGKGLTSWRLFVMFVFQVWCLIVLFPDLCHHSYLDIFYWPSMCPSCCRC